MSKSESQGLDLPNYGFTDYTKFFGAGALAATLTHGVRLLAPGPLPFLSFTQNEMSYGPPH